MFRFSCLLAVCLLILSGCTTSSIHMDAQAPPFNVNCPFNLKQSLRTWDLEAPLEEISGLGIDSSGQLWAVQDEDGIVFKLDSSTKNIIKERTFAKDGDYEGIEIYKDTAYVVNSKGELFVFSIADPSSVTEIRDLGLTEDQDVEGLCIDSRNKVLWVACKGKSPDETKGTEYKALIPYSLTTLERGEIIYIYWGDIRKYLSASNVMFKPSAISIDPVTGNFYVLTHTGKMLVVLTKEGSILHAEKLNKRVYAQPEGLCFDMNGDLYISSEASKKNPPRIFYFKRRR